MQRFSKTILARGTGLALQDALVTVYDTGTTDKATIYSENDVSSEELANPLTSDAYGEIAGYFPDGEYDFRIDHGSQPTRTEERIQIYDLLNLVANGPLATLEGNANQLPYFAGTNIIALADFTELGRELVAASTTGDAYAALEISAFVQTLLNDGDAATFRASIGAGSGGGDLFAANNLSDVANAGTARGNLGLAIGTNVQAFDADLAAIAALTTTAYGRSFLELADAAAAQTLVGVDKIYAFGLFFTTAPTASEVLCLHIAADAFTIPANFGTPNSRGVVGTNPTASFAIDVQRQVNATGAFATIGTITISTGGVFTFATASGTSKAIAANDVLKFIAPASPDATVANVAITIRGTRT